MASKHHHAGVPALTLVLVAVAAFLGGAGMYRQGSRLSNSVSPSLSRTPINPVGGVIAAAGRPGKSRPIARYFIVGVGHSGTGILLRTIGNLPGLRCIPPETYLFEREPPEKRPSMLKEWDAQAVQGSYTGWAEKTPKHILHLQQILGTPHAKVVFMIRDGRDVAASLAARSNEYTWEKSMGRWVDDNQAVLPFLSDPRVLSIKFEEFFNTDRVLGVLRQLATFVGAPAPDERLLLALQPSTTPLTGFDRCRAYPDEEAKRADLAASSIQQLAMMAALRAAAASAQAVAGGVAVEQPPDPLAHDSRRAWQSSQAWAPQESTWRQRLTPQQQADVAANEEMQRMLRHFGYA